MGHFAAGQPSSLIPSPLLSTAGISNDYAVATSNLYAVRYTANVNMLVGGDVLLFTTETGRGYFIPLYINVMAVETYGEASSTGAKISIGFESGNSYRNFVNQFQLSSAYAVYTGQWVKGQPIPGSTDYDIGGVQMENSLYARACDPTTGVYMKIVAGTATVDRRVVSILGVYLP